MFSSGGMLTRPVFGAARPRARKRIAYSRKVRTCACCARRRSRLDDGIAQPILVGRPSVIEARIAKAGLRMKLGQDVECVNPDDDPRFRQYWQAYHQHHGPARREPGGREGRGASARTTTIAALMVQLGDADGMLCGLQRSLRRAPREHPRRHRPARRRDAALATLSGLMIDKRTLFIADTYVNETPVERAARVHRAAVRARSAPLRSRAEGGLPLAFELRIVPARIGQARARGLRALLEARARRRMRRRDAWRCRAVRGHPQAAT